MPDNGKSRVEELERTHQTWVRLNTWGTVINAMGLAGGLAVVHFWPMLSVAIVVSTIAIYAIIRALAGRYERRMPFYTGGSSPVQGGGSGVGHGFFPESVSVVYEARLERKDSPVQEDAATSEEEGEGNAKED